MTKIDHRTAEASRFVGFHSSSVPLGTETSDRGRARQAYNKPNWNKWRCIPHVETWAAVALSLDIEPDDLKPVADKESAPEDYRERLSIAVENLRITLPTANQNLSSAPAALLKVVVTEFATWAEQKPVAWSLPPEFPRANPNPSTKKSGKDARELKTRERDTLLKIILALAKALEIDLDRPSKAAGVIEGHTQAIKMRVASRTIEEHLKAVSELVPDD